MAFDGKLWVWWDSLEFNASQLEAHIRSSLDGEYLEATYEAVILQNGMLVSPGLYEFDVASGSTEAKFKEDTMLTLGKLGRPGMPLENATALLSPTAPSFPGNAELLRMPLYSVLQVTLEQFDRVNAKARVALTNRQEPQFVPYLIGHSSINLLTDVFLLEKKKPKEFNWSLVSTEILREIGNPAIAVPDQNAADAMGISPASRRGTRDPVTPSARILWDAPALEQQAVTPNVTATAIAAYVTARDGLNPSQEAAVVHAAERSLTVIWGPPGTGKTKTVAAFLHGVAQEAVTHGRPLKVLVTGLTYKAVEEVMHRTADLLAQDPTSRATMYLAYSSSRTPGAGPVGLPNHVSYMPVSIDTADPDYQRCLAELSSGTGVTILGCQIRQARRFPKELMGAFVRPLFDVVIIDESSQVPVAQPLSALCGLKNDARLVIAGDHLQMPPITSIDPPSEASYLVGSIQTYLLERQFGHPVQRCILETNYRSNEHSVAFARSIGYPSSLYAAFPDGRVQDGCG